MNFSLEILTGIYHYEQPLSFMAVFLRSEEAKKHCGTLVDILVKCVCSYTTAILQ